ncbi:MAG TPA: hypothetical protein VK506_10780 [Conexibacter sp.]|nr:hypothetical protein [Conexibacter sp.]
MASAGSTAALAELRGDDSSAINAPRPHRDVLAAAAWLCAIPCALVTLVAAAMLGPPLGELMAADPQAYSFFPEFGRAVHPETTEQARYLLALGLPLLIALAIVTSPRWLSSPPPEWATAAVSATQLVLGMLIVACFVAQEQLTFGTIYTIGAGEPPFQLRYFTPATYVVAGLGVAATLLVLRRERLRDAAAALMRESPGRRVAALLVAIAATAIWMLYAVETDASLTSTAPDIMFHLGFTIDETFAVLNGLSPLVDFSAQYGSLWPYVVALPMLAFGKTVLVFTIAMCTLTGLALLAVYGVLRRVTRSSIAALPLYLPFLATSLFHIAGTPERHSTVGTYFGTFPLRYALPYLLAFLTARHIDRDAGPRSTAVLFLVGGLAVLNNGDFGLAALGATVAALLWSGGVRSRREALRSAAAAGAGLLTALALVSLLTLVRAGELPHLERLVDYARLFANAGFGMMPVPDLLGQHLVIYLTYVAAIAVATVRALDRAPDRLLTGMLAWVGIFGLGSATYYIGRSHPNTLKATFSVWALALALLTVVVVRHLAEHPRRRPTIPAIAVLLCFGLAACSLAQVPTPWSQVDRLAGPFLPRDPEVAERPLVASPDPEVRHFVSSLADGPSRFVVKQGAPVAILLPTGHRIAEEYGLRNVSEYTGIDSAPTAQRVERVLDALAKAGGNTVILPNPVDAGIFDVLERRGFRLLTNRGLRRYDPSVPHSGAFMPRWPYEYIIKWVDTRHLHPRALD